MLLGRTSADGTRRATVIVMQTQKSSSLLPVAVILVLVGAVASVALLFPVVRDSNQIIVTVTYLLAMLAPIGLLLAIVFALLSGRRSR